MSGGTHRRAAAARPFALDFVSPLPPVRSGIADYSRDLLPRLAERCDLRVVRLTGQPVAPGFETRWRPVAAGEAGRDGRLPLYQMGNNRHHEGVRELALARPGVLVLHDLVLHHLTLETTLLGGEVEPYLEQVERDHGWQGAAIGGARRWGDLGQAALFELACRRTLLRRQRGVLVHSRWAVADLAEEDPELAVRAVPMAVPLPPARDAAAGAALRARLGLPAGAPLLGSFGFQTPIKRTEVVIRALARPELAAAHLLVVGEVSPVLDLAGEARAAGVADRVHLHGFLDYADFEAAIAACDLAVNLRYPTAGETSASLLRVLAIGLPSLVSDYAQFAELPDAVAAKVPLGDDEAARLAATAGRLLADRGRLRAMGEAAREHVRREHDPGVAAARIVEACRELGALAPPGDRPPAPAAPTSLTWSELPGSLAVGGADGGWPAGAARRLDLALANDGPATWLRTGVEGGLLVGLAWRDEVAGRTLERSWVPLATDLPAGARRRLAARTRRPPGARVLVVEPHVEGFGGLHALGGPRIVLDVETGAEIRDAWRGTRVDLERGAGGGR